MAALALGAASMQLTCLGRSLESPDTQIRKALLQQQRANLEDVYGPGTGGTVELHPIRFADVTATVEEGRATVIAMLSAEGRVTWRDQDAKLAYMGRERFHMKPCADAPWCAERDQFERLRGVLGALFRRHDAFQQHDVSGYGRLLAAAYQDRGEDRSAALRRLQAEFERAAGRARIVAWQIRVDRGGAEVGEDVEITAAGVEPRRERHVYHLSREGERWVFTGGV